MVARPATAAVIASLHLVSATKSRVLLPLMMPKKKARKGLWTARSLFQFSLQLMYNWLRIFLTIHFFFGDGDLDLGNGRARSGIMYK